MRKLSVFNHISVDGFFVDASGDMSWAHRANQDAEWTEFVAGNAKGGGTLLFGRVTYAMMASYWPTAQALESNRVVAERMNQLPKIVFSRTLDKATWNNTRLIKGDLAAEVRNIKREPGTDLVIFGSSTLVAQLAQHGLIDSYQFIVNPIALGQGRTLFEGINERLPLRLTQTRAFANGNVLLCYEPQG